MYDAAGEARNATALAISYASAKRPAGISCNISFFTSSNATPVREDLFSMMPLKRTVFVAPGNTLLTVIPNCATSLESVLDQLATAARMVLETPNPFNGILTEVDMILM